MCDWCGHEHARTALCTKRPTWGRRGFLALFGCGLVGLVLGSPAQADPWKWEMLSIGDAGGFLGPPEFVRELCFEFQAESHLWLAV